MRAMTLRSNYDLVLGHKANGPTYFKVDPFLYRNGSDGSRSLTCINLTVMFLPRYTHQDYLSNISTFIDILSQRQPTFQALISA